MKIEPPDESRSTYNEKALASEVEALRQRTTDTRQLYREVAALVFFKHGITPTTNRLYQLVRKGSMGTVTTALASFWQDLRDKSRIRIDHPGVPDTIKGAAGDLLHTLWEQALVQAQAGFDAAIAEAQAERLTADNARAGAEEALEATRIALEARDKVVEQTTADKEALRTELNAERGAHGRAQATLVAARQEVETLRQDLAAARHDFAGELTKAREAVGLSEERLAAAERRALVEIDRERTARAELDKQLRQVREAAQLAAEAAHQRLAEQTGQLGEVRGRLEAANAELARRESELAASRAALEQAQQHAARLGGEVESLKGQFRAINDKPRARPGVNKKATGA